MATTVVFGGGPTPPEQIRRALVGVQPDLVIAADSGLEGCLAAGLHCDVVIGDMDSVAPDALDRARRLGASIERHDVDKDATDLELALDRALAGEVSRPGSSEVLVIGSGAGRLDHLVATVALVCAPRYAGADLTAVLGTTTVVPVHRDRRIAIAEGTEFSVLALHGAVSGLSLGGVRWPLSRADLAPGSTHGVSNVSTGDLVEVSVESGTATVLVPQPGPTGERPPARPPARPEGEPR